MLFFDAIVVDFDGFLVEPAYPFIGSLREGAKEFLQQLRSSGYKIIISSCRNNNELNSQESHRISYVEEMHKFMDSHELPYDWIDDGKHGKPIGRAYCDDKNVPYYNHRDSKLIFEMMLEYIKRHFKSDGDVASF